MRDERLAFLRRAAAPVAASIALHLAVVAGTTSVLLGGVLGLASFDDSPLVVEILVDEERPSAAAAPRRESPPASARLTRAPRPPSPAVPAATASMPPKGTVPEGPGKGGKVSWASGPTVEARDRSADAAISAGMTTAAAEAEAGDGLVAEAERPGTVDSADPSTPAHTTALVAGGPPDSPAAVAATSGEVGADATVAQAPAGDAAAAAVDERAVVAARGRLGEVTRNASVSARAESEPFVGRRDIFEFLLDHPDFATHVTRALRLARYRVWRTDDGMFIDDGWGATGQLTVIHAASGSRVVYAKGEFQHKFLPSIPGEAVVTIDYDAWPTADGREMLHARISGQLKIEGGLAALVLKVANSVAVEKAEKESRRLVTVMARVLRAIDETPAAVYASLRDRPDVPQAELEQFRALLRLP
jgi:hypothetical protein